MHRRCSAKATGKTRRLYYEKGIRVCERWGTFAHFLADMGPRPSPRHSLERLDGDAGYGPGNVEWALPRR